MDMTNEQIEREFRRQVRLCRGIGLDSMLSIVCDEMDSVRVMTPKDLDDALRKAERYSANPMANPVPTPTEPLSRPECPFNYCDTKPPHDECRKGCRHATTTRSA